MELSLPGAKMWWNFRHPDSESSTTFSLLGAKVRVTLLLSLPFDGTVYC